MNFPEFNEIIELKSKTKMLDYLSDIKHAFKYLLTIQLAIARTASEAKKTQHFADETIQELDDAIDTVDWDDLEDEDNQSELFLPSHDMRKALEIFDLTNSPRAIILSRQNVEHMLDDSSEEAAKADLLGLKTRLNAVIKTATDNNIVIINDELKEMQDRFSLGISHLVKSLKQNIDYVTDSYADSLQVVSSMEYYFMSRDYDSLKKDLKKLDKSMPSKSDFELAKTNPVPFKHKNTNSENVFKKIY